MTEFTIQALGFLASLSIILEGLSKTRKKVIIFGILCSFFALIQYFMSGNMSLIPICIITITRIISSVLADKYKFFDSNVVLVFFMILYSSFYMLGILGITKTQGTISKYWLFLVMISSLIACYGYKFRTPLLLKSFLTTAQLGWFVFDLVSQYYTSLIGDIFTIIANIIAITVIVYETKHPKEKKLPDNPISVITQAVPIITRSIPIVTSKIQKVETNTIKTITQSNQIISKKKKDRK